MAQHGLAYRLATATSLEEALPTCLDIALRSQMDCGGIYLIDSATGDLHLAYTRGLSPAFIEATRFVPAQSNRARMVKTRQTQYLDYGRDLPSDQNIAHENIRMVAILPLTYQGRVVGCFNLASHRYTAAEISPAARTALEEIAAQVGHVIVRLQTEAALHESEKRFRTIFFEDRAVKLLGVAIFDLDHFKQVNDTYGHPVGDDVLRWVATQCGALLPPEAVLGRIGGEEFAVILPNADEPRAVATLEVVRQHVAGLPIPTRRGKLTVTMSIGVATLHACHEVTLDELLEYADQALYQAKRAGRNRISIASYFRNPDQQWGGHS
ncbi:MAG: sensor domain-containing diguanylate cyclase [Chloroflexales bacterium]